MGDVVDAQFQDGKFKGRWFRGRIANVSDEDVTATCDIIYYDGDVSGF